MDIKKNNWNNYRSILSKVELSQTKDVYKKLYDFYYDTHLYKLCNSLIPYLDDNNLFINQSDIDNMEKENKVLDQFKIDNHKQYKYRVVYLPFTNYPNYGLDNLYDGLCKVIGWDMVIDYPPKGTLHGESSTQCLNYPCFYDYPNKVFSELEILDCIKKSEIDFIIYCYNDNNQNNRLIEKINKISSVPIYVVDQEDTFEINYQKIFSFKNVRKIFKREMLLYNDYDKKVLPLNFSYPSEYISDKFHFKNKRNDSFWAGKKYYTRGHYLDILSKYTSKENINSGIFTKEQYLNKISDTKIGINLFGWGFDTVRYYEFPANCCLLLTEDPQIHILNPLEDKTHCIKFYNTYDFEDKLSYYLKNEKESEEISMNGYNHIKRYHTNEYRANQLLDYIETDLN